MWFCGSPAAQPSSSSAAQQPSSPAAQRPSSSAAQQFSSPAAQQPSNQASSFFSRAHSSFVDPKQSPPIAGMPSLAQVRGLPPTLVALVACVWQQVCVLEQIGLTRDLHGHELYCGKAAISRSAIDRGYAFMGFDKERDPTQDILKMSGLHQAIIGTLKVQQRGLQWAAIDCRTLSWMNRATVGRKDEAPAGYVQVGRVRDANLMIGVTVTLLVLGWLRDVYWIVENPSGSMLPKVEPMRSWVQFLFQTLSPQSFTYLGAFGAESLKKVMFWSNWPGCRRLNVKMPTSQWSGEPFVKLAKKGKWVDGDSKKLRSSAAYPEAFGAKVVEEFAADFQDVHAPGATATVLGMLGGTRSCSNAEWRDVKELVDELILQLPDDLKGMDLHELILKLQAHQDAGPPPQRKRPAGSGKGTDTRAKAARAAPQQDQHQQQSQEASGPGSPNTHQEHETPASDSEDTPQGDQPPEIDISDPQEDTQPVIDLGTDVATQEPPAHEEDTADSDVLVAYHGQGAETPQPLQDFDAPPNLTWEQLGVGSSPQPALLRSHATADLGSSLALNQDAQPQTPSPTRRMRLRSKTSPSLLINKGSSCDLESVLPKKIPVAAINHSQLLQDLFEPRPN